MSFDSLGLSEAILRAVKEQGYTVPTPIQLQAIPAILAGRDVLAAAQTGTGKTAGFTLPILQLLSSKEVQGKHTVRTLVLTPTRELAAQVADDVRDYGRHLGLRSAVVFGGVGLQPQLQALRRGVDILIATPGRLLDLHSQGAIDFSALEILVLDEADRMLDMGFINDIRKIMGLLPNKRQNLLFSATFSPEIRRMAEGLLHDPQTIEVAPRNTAAESVEQWVHPVDKSRKSDLLCHLIKEKEWPQVLVFTRTKHGANRLSEKLERAGISSAAIHGNKSQAARTRALHDFKQGEVRVLVATDIAARGLDIEQLPQVVNFELPNVPEDYVHRIGRTGRAGASGSALSLVSADERSMLHGIERLLRKKLRSEVVPGFEPGTGSAVDVDDVRPPRQPRGQPRSAGAGRPAHSQPRSSSNSTSSDPARSRHGSGGQPRSNDGARPARTGDNRSNGGGRHQQGQRRSSAPAYVGIYDSTRHGLHDAPPRGDVDGNRITSPGNAEVQRGQAPHLSSHEQPPPRREGQGRPRGHGGGGAGRGGNPSRSGSGGRPAHARSSQPRQRSASDAYNDRDGGSPAPTTPKKPIIIVKTW